MPGTSVHGQQQQTTHHTRRGGMCRRGKSGTFWRANHYQPQYRRVDCGKDAAVSGHCDRAGARMLSHLLLARNKNKNHTATSRAVGTSQPMRRLRWRWHRDHAAHRGMSTRKIGSRNVCLYTGGASQRSCPACGQHLPSTSTTHLTVACWHAVLNLTDTLPTSEPWLLLGDLNAHLGTGWPSNVACSLHGEKRKELPGGVCQRGRLVAKTLQERGLHILNGCQHAQAHTCTTR